MLQWPELLPCNIIQGSLEKSFREGRLRTEPQRGRAFKRVVTSVAPMRVGAQTLMTVGQWARLEQFWDEDTEGGVLPFLIHDHVYHAQPLTYPDGAPILSSSGEVLRGVYWWIVMFGSPPVSRRLGKVRRMVSFELEII